jgi:endoglucanase
MLQSFNCNQEGYFMFSKQFVSIFTSTIIVLLSFSTSVAEDYENALHLSTKFFGAQRCGNTDSWIHGTCHDEDGSDEGVDLTGGWHDCGDHVKFGQTNGFAAALLLHGYLNFESAYPDSYSPVESSGGGNDIPDILDEVKYYTDYALKTLVGSTLSSQKLFFQVSDADIDHATLYIPEETPTDRESHYEIGGGISNIAGTNAAVLAMMYRAYKDHNSTYANECLAMAKKMYEFGDADHVSQGSVNEEKTTYDAGPWVDDMLFGAVELYAATNDDKYLDAAKDFIASSDFTDGDILPSGFVLDYSNVATVAAHSYLKHIESNANLESRLVEEVEAYGDSVISNGMAFFSQWGSLKYSAGAAYVALLANDLELSTNIDVSNFAKGQIDFILGDHGNLDTDAPSGFSFLSSYKASSPTGQLHHCAAAGFTLSDFSMSEWNNSNNDNDNDLAGALVGGPTSKSGDYVNERSDFFTNEVCIYYNAPFVAAVGAMIGTESSIVISNSSLSSGQATGTEVAVISAVDPDADNFSYSLTAGGDDFSISGNKLLTSSELAVGSYDITIKATSDKDPISKSFTIVVKDGGSENNLAFELGWYAFAGGGSTLNSSQELLETEDLLVDGTITCKFNAGSGDKVYHELTYYVDSSSAKSYENSSYIKIEYRSDNDFALQLPMGSVTDYAYYHVILPSTNDILKSEIFNLTDAVFAQYDWGKSDVAFKLDEVLNVIIAPNFEDESGTISIETFEVEGFEATPILSVNRVSQVVSRPSLTSLTANQMKIAVPKTGNYKVDLFSVSGRKIGSFSKNFSAGSLNSLNWNGAAISSQMIIVQITGAGLSSLTKALVK